MNNEQLKKIAEKIGWTKVWIEVDVTSSIIGCPPDSEIKDVFYPENNPAQILEIEDWLFNEDLEVSNSIRNGIYYCDAWLPESVTIIENKGKTRAEALLNTAWEVIK